MNDVNAITGCELSPTDPVGFTYGLYSRNSPNGRDQVAMPRILAFLVFVVGFERAFGSIPSILETFLLDLHGFAFGVA